jgi:KEOPS complex subunit Cgi121
LLFELLDRKVWISAYHGSANPTQLSRVQAQFPKVAVQLFDLDRIAGSRHILLATFNAVKSYDSKRRISRSLGMEILLFISGTRQISEAIKRVGITSKTRRTAVLSVLPADADQSKVSDSLSEIFGEKEDDSLLDKWTSLRRSRVVKTFGMGDKELKAASRAGELIEKAIERLAIERSAMLAIAK